jgi:hypothetical protein
VDVVQVLEAAVVTGAAAAAKDQASAAVSGAVTSLWDAVRRAFGADPIGPTAMEKLQDAPAREAQAWREQLRSRLQALPEAELRELTEQAQAVLALTDPEGTTSGRYTLTAERVGTAVAGDVTIQAETQGVAGWNVGNVSIGGPADRTAGWPPGASRTWCTTRPRRRWPRGS